MRFTGMQRPEEFRTVTRAHIIAWRDELARRTLGGSTFRRRLASLASLCEYPASWRMNTKRMADIISACRG
jgi:integrase/recombinase XerD